jgi:DNA-3-methyladenine glycosylase
MDIQPDRQLPHSFYLRTDVLQVARDLLGKVLVTTFDGRLTSGIITEVEAYRAPEDRASHAYGNRLTNRTEVMFREGGCAYIYICYGIHHLFNVVTGPEGTPHAVLIRGVEPLDGVEWMLERRNAGVVKPALTTGPGALAVALGLTTAFNGQRLLAADSPIRIEAGPRPLEEAEIAAGKRIGVESAGESAHWPWRFWVQGNRFVKKGPDSK